MAPIPLRPVPGPEAAAVFAARDGRRDHYGPSVAGVLMDAQFQSGDIVRRKGTDLEMTVEGYDPDGRVRCSFLKGIARMTTSYDEADLERIPSPDLPPASSGLWP